MCLSGSEVEFTSGSSSMYDDGWGRMVGKFQSEGISVSPPPC